MINLYSTLIFLSWSESQKEKSLRKHLVPSIPSIIWISTYGLAGPTESSEQVLTGPGGPFAEDLDRCSYLVEITSGHSLFFWWPNVVSCPNMSALFSIFIVQFEKNFDSNKFWKSFIDFIFEFFVFERSKIRKSFEELFSCSLLVKQAVGL